MKGPVKNEQEGKKARLELNFSFPPRESEAPVTVTCKVAASRPALAGFLNLNADPPPGPEGKTRQLTTLSSLELGLELELIRPSALRDQIRTQRYMPS